MSLHDKMNNKNSGNKNKIYTYIIIFKLKCQTGTLIESKVTLGYFCLWGSMLTG